MAISYTIDEARGVVFITWVGTASEADVVRTHRRLYESEQWKPGFHQIVDVQKAQPGDITIDSLRELASLIESYVSGKCEGFKTAVIAPEDVLFGLARAYEAVSEESPENVMVFRERASALDWIGVDELSVG
jgi:hypothetical protein